MNLFGLVEFVEIGDDLGDDEVLGVARQEAESQHDVLSEIGLDELAEELLVVRVCEVDRGGAQSLVDVRICVLAVDY